MGGEIERRQGMGTMPIKTNDVVLTFDELRRKFPNITFRGTYIIEMWDGATAVISKGICFDG
jgi:hypothetical protein